LAAHHVLELNTGGPIEALPVVRILPLNQNEPRIPLNYLVCTLTSHLISQGGGMKGRISLRDFIKEVRAELEQAKAEEKDAFFELQEVTLEVAFSLDVSGKGAGKFIVVDLSGEAKASQSHKVVLKLQPYSGDAAPAVRVPVAPRTAAQSSGIGIDSPLGPYLNLIRQRPGGRFLLGDVTPTFTSDLILGKSPWLPDLELD
jgi:hypothetical protein